MASAIATGRAERIRRRRFWAGSRLGRLIVALNILGLAILVVGALTPKELRRGLIQARLDGLTTEGELIANEMEEVATQGSPEPALQADRATLILRFLDIPGSQRARLFDARGQLLADSYLAGDRVESKPLPPVRKPGALHIRLDPFAPKPDPKRIAAARAELKWEIGRALRGEIVSGLRHAENGGQVVSVSVPVQRVKAVLGVLTMETGDVESIVAAQRRALAPFILAAAAGTLLSSFLLTWLVARPVMRLAGAADRVRLAGAREISLPSIARRDDELGDLARSLQAMTAELSQRMDAIESFAADVAHEIRNPLTSIRSAVETLDLVKEGPARQRLLAILKQDVGRLDRLITDISNASRLDAELSREAPRVLDLGKLLSEIAGLYSQSGGPEEGPVQYAGPPAAERARVMGREGPVSQVIRNLIDNARSFSPPGAKVLISLARAGRDWQVRIDDNGPGIPPENLETVFERFYTARPKGAAFGGHSGLGLSIARQIVEAHGGRVWAENRTDGSGAVTGARFVVSLPEPEP